MFHRHFEWPRPEGDDAWEDPVSFLTDLIEERTLIQDWKKAGEWSGSSTLERGTEPDTEDMSKDNTVHVRSWTGALDRVIKHASLPRLQG